jgi:hypothetical protein
MTRPRSSTLIFASTLGLALVAVPVLPAFAGDEGPNATTENGTTTIKVFEKQIGEGSFIPKGGEPGDFPTDENFVPSDGDAFTFHNDLSQGDTKVGTDDGKCTLVKVATNTNHCVVTLKFAGGTLTADDTLSFPEDDSAFDVALVSGTGAYQGAAGNVHVTPDSENNDNSHLILTFSAGGGQVAEVPSGGAATGGGFTGDSSDTALLIGLGGIAALAGFGLLAGGRRLAVPRRND